MNLKVFIVRLLVQLFWGLFCFLHSPGDVMLTVLNVGAFLLTLASRIAPMDFGLAVAAAWATFYIVPIYMIGGGALSSFFELQNGAAEAMGIKLGVPTVGGSSAEYHGALRNYVVALAIPPFFAAVNWVVNKASALR
ncbi:MAG: hypothetical protein ACK5UX_14450 [Burkholderiales bacterium]